MESTVLASEMDRRTPVMDQTTVKRQKKLVNEFRVSLATMATTATQIREQIHIVETRWKSVVVMVKVLAHWIGMIVMETIEIGMRVIVNNQEVMVVTHSIRWVV